MCQNGTVAIKSPFTPASRPRTDLYLRRPDCVHLLLCTDAVFLQHVAVCVVSVLANNPDLFFDIVVAGRGQLDEGKLRGSLAEFRNHSLTFREFSPPPNLLLPLEEHAHQTIDAYTRLWVAEFFPSEVNRVLYLDGDIVVVGNIAPLWNMDLGGALVGAVDVPGSEKTMARFEICAKDGYFNSGVFLIDLAQWRETRALDQALDYITANAERVRHDQDALNACFHDRRKHLEYRWNAMWPFFYPAVYGTPLLPFSKSKIEAVRRSAQIIHFNGPMKPWSYLCDHPRRAEYWRYLKLTEWRDFIPPDRTLKNRIRILVSPVRRVVAAMLPQHVKRLLRTNSTRV
jgi:lipopolysaccharide biosynthesis glycosyltransferase